MDDVFDNNKDNAENRNKQEKADSENLIRGGTDNKLIHNFPRIRTLKHVKHLQDRVSVSTTDCEDLYVMKDTDEELEDDVFTASGDIPGQHKLQEELHSEGQHQDQQRDTCYVRCRRCFKVMRRKSYIQTPALHCSKVWPHHHPHCSIIDYF